MKRITTAIAVLAVAVMPSFAADLSKPGTGGNPGKKGSAGVREAMRQVPPDYGVKYQMMRNPQHLLMMAFHRNVANFGHTLYRAASQGETVPVQLARVSIAEMRRSIEEMEKYRATAMRDMQVNMDRQKMMDEHLVQVKTHLRQLEELAKGDRIDSKEVIKHLQPMFEGCEGADCDLMSGRDLRGGRMYGGRWGGRGGGMRGCQCQQMMPERAAMMEEMMRKMKSQDAELAGLVQEMQGAPRDRKLDLVTEVVTRMVQQRIGMTAEMERMQRHMMRRQGATMAPGAMMNGMEDEDFDEDQGEDMEDDYPEDVTPQDMR